ncbi:MAG: hypothetical protein HY786_07200 [Deltaproteobacteria bacterium]|nr:hypothetical protein [Deltaproteobacteria bacterium]
MRNEADTCRKYILPKLIEAGWDNNPHSFTEQKTFTDGRIVVAGSRVSRPPQKRADYFVDEYVDRINVTTQVCLTQSRKERKENQAILFIKVFTTLV